MSEQIPRSSRKRFQATGRSHGLVIFWHLGFRKSVIYKSSLEVMYQKFSSEHPFLPCSRASVGYLEYMSGFLLYVVGDGLGV